MQLLHFLYILHVDGRVHTTIGDDAAAYTDTLTSTHTHSAALLIISCTGARTHITLWEAQMTGLKYSSTKKGNCITVTVGGSLDAQTAPTFEKKIADEITKKPKVLVVSMEGLEYIASAGMGTLINANEKMIKNGGSLRLAACTPKVEKIIKMLGFSNFFAMYDSTAAAEKE